MGLCEVGVVGWATAKQSVACPTKSAIVHGLVLTCWARGCEAFVEFYVVPIYKKQSPRRWLCANLRVPARCLVVHLRREIVGWATAKQSAACPTKMPSCMRSYRYVGHAGVMVFRFLLTVGLALALRRARAVPMRHTTDKKMKYTQPSDGWRRRYSSSLSPGSPLTRYIGRTGKRVL